MKLGVVGSSPLLDNVSIRAMIQWEIEAIKPTTLVLVPNPKFNAFVKEIAKKNGIRVDELKPARPSWLGRDKQSRRKSLLRNLYANYVAGRSDLVLVFFQRGAAGVTGKAVLQYAVQNGVPSHEMHFSL